MPKRTNDFQKLILAINSHFSSGSATVTESAMLFDAESEQDREIDILIQDEVGGYELKIGVECTAIQRPMTVGKLAELVDKHKNVGINKSVIVSKSGFAKSTQKKAKKLGIDLISYEAAIEKDWPKDFEMLTKIKPVHVSCELREDLPLTLLKGSTLNGFSNDGDYTVVENGGFLSKLLIELLNEHTNGRMLPPYLNDVTAESDGVYFSQSWSFDPPITLRCENGNTAKIIGAKPTYIYRRKSLIGELKGGIYNGQVVATSILKNSSIFKESRFTISSVRSKSGENGLSVSLSLDTY